MRKDNLLWLAVIFFAGVLMIGIFFMTYSMGRFQAGTFFRRGAGSVSGSAAQVSGPDLYLHSMRFDPFPKAGEPVGVMYIAVGNQGTEESIGSSVSVACRPSGSGKNGCPACLCGASAEFGSVPAGGSLQVAVPCADKWNEGEFHLGVTVDPLKYVRDRVRGNNVNFMDISVRPAAGGVEMPAGGYADGGISADYPIAVPAGDLARRSDGAVSAGLPAKAVVPDKVSVPAALPRTLFMSRDGSPFAHVPSAGMPGLKVLVGGAELKSVFSGCSGIPIESVPSGYPVEKSVPLHARPQQRGDSCEFFIPGFDAAVQAVRPKCPGSYICVWDVVHGTSGGYFNKTVSFFLKEAVAKGALPKSTGGVEEEIFTPPDAGVGADSGNRAVPEDVIELPAVFPGQPAAAPGSGDDAVSAAEDDPMVPEAKPFSSVPFPVEFAYLAVSPAGKAGSPRVVTYRLFNNGPAPVMIGSVELLAGERKAASDTLEALIAPWEWDKARSLEVPDTVCGERIQLIAYEDVGVLDKGSPRKVAVPVELPCMTPGEKPDLDVSSVTTELSSIYIGQEIPVSCTVKNSGQVASPAVPLWVLAIDGTGALPKHSRHTAEVGIPELKPGQEYDVMFKAVVTGAGDLSGFEVIADPLDIIAESDERNNRSIFMFSENNCFGSKKEYDASSMADFSVDSFELLPMPSDLCLGMVVQAGCRICYDAAGGGAGAAKVSLYAGEEVFAGQEVSFPGKERCRLLFFDWKVACGEKLSVTVEPAAGGGDRDVGNNTASLTVVCRDDGCSAP